MAAVVFGKIPDSNTARTIAAYDLALVRMNHNVIGGAPVVVASLDCSGSRLPDLDCAILGRCDHPFAFAMKSDSCDIASVAFERQERVGVRGLDVVELDGMMTSGSQVSLIRRDAEAIDLRVRMLNRTRADPGKSFPEPLEVLVVSRTGHECLRVNLTRT